jgi:hypothetical protein
MTFTAIVGQSSRSARKPCYRIVIRFELRMIGLIAMLSETGAER